MALTRPASGLCLLAAGAFLGGVLLAAATRHDQRFDDADAALEKAAVLVEAASCETSGKAQRECERQALKTSQHIESARAALAAAMAAADSGLE